MPKDLSLVTTISTSVPVQVFTSIPADKTGPYRRYLIINPANSGAYDFSLDGGRLWHLRPGSTSTSGQVSECLPQSIADASQFLVRPNGGTAISNLVVELYPE